MKIDDVRVLFMGTPDFAVPSLSALIDAGYRVVGVVTQPDRPKGRKRVLTPPPVKVEAERAGIPVLQPEKLRRPEAVAAVLGFQPDLIVTAAYGQILPKAVLDAPRYGCINVHASLLPKYRGGAPVHYAVMNGETKTGVTLMYMDEGLDTGDMISKVEVPILETDTAGTMFGKLAEAGAQLLIETLPKLLAGEVRAEPQNAAEATYARNLTREDERIDWRRTSREIFNHVRGLNPWPVAYTTWNGEVLKVWEAAPPQAAEAGAAPAAVAAASGGADEPGETVAAVPGTVLALGERGITVRTGDGAIVLTVVQPAGKKAMPAGELVKGGRMTVGTRLGGDGA
jgi:methionyl-tRNA formyltransferase